MFQEGYKQRVLCGASRISACQDDWTGLCLPEIDLDGAALATVLLASPALVCLCHVDCLGLGSVHKSS